MCSSYNRRQGKKPPFEQIRPSAKLQPNSNDEFDPEHSVRNNGDMEPSVNREKTFEDDVDARGDAEHTDEKNLGTQSASAIETNRDVNHADEQIKDSPALSAVAKASVRSFTKCWFSPFLPLYTI